MTPIRIITLPYIFGSRQLSEGNSMAAGPLELLASEALARGLSKLKGRVSTVVVNNQDEPAAPDAAGKEGIGVAGFFHGDQMSRMWAQHSRLASAVSKARAELAFPVALTGSCSASVGMIAGLGEAADFGVVWLDAHDDASTPETSTSGLVEGMPVSMIAGRCWKNYCLQHMGFRPVPEDRILTIGLHERYEGQQKDYSDLPGAHVTPDDLGEAGFETGIAEALRELRSRVGRIYLHVDLDVLDPSEARVNRYMADGGFTRQQLDYVIRECFDIFEVDALTFCSFDPTVDPCAKEIVGGIVADALNHI
jgi:arginase